MPLKKKTQLIRADVEFVDIARAIASENGIKMTDATRVIARRLTTKKSGSNWSIC